MPFRSEDSTAWTNGLELNVSEGGQGIVYLHNHLIPTLTHITDCGSPSGDGVDTTIRIEKQYRRLGVLARVISAGHSPMHIAFCALTDLQLAARQKAHALRERLGLSKKIDTHFPIALNCAPRNSKALHSDGKEDYIYRLKTSEDTYLIYGNELMRLALSLSGRQGASVEKIISIDGVIEDTSSGSQFRSAEHLPVVHYLELKGLLDKMAKKESVDLDTLIDPIAQLTDAVLPLPADEFSNGRLLVNNTVFERLIKHKVCTIYGLVGTDDIKVTTSLTQVVPGEISIWPSSNHFPNKNYKVVNIGTRFKAGETQTTNTDVKKLCKKLSDSVGFISPVEIQVGK